MRRTWVSLASLVLSLALLTAAVVSLTRGDLFEACLAVVLAAGWGVTAVRRVGGRVGRNAARAAPVPSDRARTTG